MAYVATVAKENVSKIDDNNFMITIHVSIEDDVNPGVYVLDENFSKRYNDSWTVGDIKQALQKKIQRTWDEYIAEKAIFDAVAFDNMVGQIETALETYINS